MTHRDRAGDASGHWAGRREAAGPAGHRRGFPTPPPNRPLPVRPRDRNGGFPRLSDGVPHGLRCPASPRHALLAESPNLEAWGTSSLWVIISAPWYKIGGQGNPGLPDRGTGLTHAPQRDRLVRERTAHIDRIKGLLFGQPAATAPLLGSTWIAPNSRVTQAVALSLCQTT